MLPELEPARGIEPGGGLVQVQERRAPDQARGEVQPATHAARVASSRACRRVGEVERLEQLRRPAPGVGGPRIPSSRPIMYRFSLPESSSSTAAYWPVSPISRRTLPRAGGPRRTRPPTPVRRRARAGSTGPGSPWSCRRRSGPSRPNTVPSRRDHVDAVERPDLAERLDEAFGLDRGCHRVHPPSSRTGSSTLPKNAANARCIV